MKDYIAFDFYLRVFLEQINNFSSLKYNRKILFLFLALGFVLYGNTLGHDYTLDDAIVVNDNAFTKKGLSGIWDQLSNDQFVGFYGEKKELVSGGRYRPLSMVVFNIQYAIAGENPFIGHLCNVLMYILNGYLLFLLLSKLFHNYDKKIKGISLALLVSLLWFFHPIHTEVVANIKGLDEMMAFAGECISLLLVLKFLETEQKKYLFWLIPTYFLALLSKENAITWLAIIPFSIYFFTNHTFKKAVPAYLSLLLAASVWFVVRYKVVGGGISSVADSIMNDPFLYASLSEKYSTIVLTLGKYLQLLVFPHPLTYDYYPKHIPIVGWKNSLVILSLMAYLALFVFAIQGLFKKNIYAYAIIVFVVTLSIASNLIFPIGAFMNERFVYVSSLGFCIALGHFLFYQVPGFMKHKKKADKFIQIILIIIALLYAGKTISRNLVWESNYTLSTHDAQISKNGAKSNIMAGGIILEEKVPAAKTAQEREKLINESISYLNRAISIYPEYIDALLLMGNAQWEKHKSAKQAMPYYYQILSINPNHQNTLSNSLIILEQEKDIDYRIQAYETLIRYNPNQAQIYMNLGRAYGQYKNDLNKASQYIETAYQINPNNYDIVRNLAVVYGLSQQFGKTVPILKKAIALQPGIAQNYIDLAVSYYHLGDMQNAKAYMDQAMQIDPNIDRSKYPV